MKKIILSFVAAIMVVSMASAARREEVTLVMVPREDAAIRVGLDIANRYPTLLVSYKVSRSSVSLHGWNGTEWVNIKPADFASGQFFRTGPDSTLIIEAEGEFMPDSLIPPAEWCDSVYKITTTHMRPLVHLIGQYYNFKHKDWAWFSENYKMSMEAINPEGLNVAWYHKRLDDNLKKSLVAGDDLQYWVALRYPQPVVEVEMLEEPLIIETNELDTAEAVELDPIFENPLTNAAPAAVVIGAGYADESKKAE